MLRASALGQRGIRLHARKPAARTDWADGISRPTRVRDCRARDLFPKRGTMMTQGRKTRPDSRGGLTGDWSTLGTVHRPPTWTLRAAGFPPVHSNISRAGRRSRFDPLTTGHAFIPMSRSALNPLTGTKRPRIREPADQPRSPSYSRWPRWSTGLIRTPRRRLRTLSGGSTQITGRNRRAPPKRTMAPQLIGWADRPHPRRHPLFVGRRSACELNKSDIIRCKKTFVICAGEPIRQSRTAPAQPRPIPRGPTSRFYRWTRNVITSGRG